MGQLCFREEQEMRSNSKKQNRLTGTKNLIDQAPSKQTAYRFQIDNFENLTNEKKYFYSMFFYNKIQKKILKLSHVSKKKSQELSSYQIQKLCASLGQYIQYLQTIQEKFQLYDQVYEESEKGYLESDAYSMTFDDSLRNITFSSGNNPNSNGNGSCVGGLSAKKFTLAKTISQGNNNDEQDNENNETIDNNQSTQSTNNYNQIIPKFDSQEVKEHLIQQRMSALKGVSDQNEQQNEEDLDKIMIKGPNSCGSVLLYDMDSDPERANSNNNQNLNNNNNNKDTNKDSGHFSMLDKDNNHLQTINEESTNVNNLLFNSNILTNNSLLQLGDSNILSQISINDLQNALPNYEVSEIFGRISERLEQPLLITEFHKISHETKTRVASYRVQLEVLFEDGGKKQKQSFFTSPLIQSAPSTSNCNLADIQINEVFEFMSEIHLSNTSYTKFKVSIYYTPLKKENPSRKESDEGSPLRKQKGSLPSSQGSPPKDQNKKSNKVNGSIVSNHAYAEDKAGISSASSSSSNSSNQNQKNTNTNNHNDSNASNEDAKFNSQELSSDQKASDEIKLTSQVVDLKKYMDQEIQYLTLKFTNKSAKQKVNLNPIKLNLQMRFQFVYDQRNLVNNLMNDLCQQKTILEEILQNLSNSNNQSNIQHHHK